MQFDNKKKLSNENNDQIGNKSNKIQLQSNKPKNNH